MLPVDTEQLWETQSCCNRSLRQSRLNEVFLQLLVDHLQLSVCLLDVEESIVNGYPQVVDL